MSEELLEVDELELIGAKLDRVIVLLEAILEQGYSAVGLLALLE